MMGMRPIHAFIYWPMHSTLTLCFPPPYLEGAWTHGGGLVFFSLNNTRDR